MSIHPDPSRYPKLVIQYCSKCKWQNRAIWYVQEILQTFPTEINDISIQPIHDFPGIFQIIIYHNDNTKDGKIIYKRRFKGEKYRDENVGEYVFDGFPDSKFLKLLIKDELGLGPIGNHLEKYRESKLNEGECVDCKTES
ncbi:hypothetical protein G210_2685, partial [Candida maltosa Xu316]